MIVVISPTKQRSAEKWQTAPATASEHIVRYSLYWTQAYQ
jgi:hypothetical protein